MFLSHKRVIQILQEYHEHLNDYEPKRDGNKFEHIRWMCEEAERIVNSNDLERANRWLGFIQGVLFTENVFTWEEIEKKSRPIYRKLKIEANDPNTEIWVGTLKGEFEPYSHLVQKEVGVMDTSLAEGEYGVSFGLKNPQHPFNLDVDKEFKEGDFDEGSNQ